MNSNSNRRQFCHTSARYAAACIAANSWGVVNPEARAADVQHAIGQHIYKSLKWNMVKLPGTVAEKFAVIKELGFDGIELDCPSDIDADAALAASQQTGLPIEGVVNSTHWKIRHSDPDPAVRRQAAENMSQALNFAARVGADSVLLVPGKVTDAEHENHDQVWERSITEIRQLLPLAQQLQVKILIENVGNGFCESPELLAEYIDELNSPWLQVHFDIGNHIRISPPAEWIRVLGKRIKKLDVKDRTQQNEATLIGEGQADWKAVRDALVDLDYRGWAAAEVTGGDREQLADVLARMNRVLGKSTGNPSNLRRIAKSS
jgi:L-ribulose-5-phosphate 3-epimerase